MDLEMTKSLVLIFLAVFCVQEALFQGTGSGKDGNLRLCIVEGRGTYKRGYKFCPVLDQENSGIECVIGTDRLDCLRRIHKGSVDFGVFSPEDLIAAQWYNVDVLVINELRTKQRPFARNIVAVVNNRILRDRTAPTSVSDILRNTTLCHPAADTDDLRPLSETLARYLESLVTENQCDPNLSLIENHIKAIAAFFNKACMAGAWVPDAGRDAELKRQYPSLCAACASSCSKDDSYWGDSGALICLSDRAGDVTWANLDDALKFFKGDPHADQYSFLCKDGSSQPLNATDPCVWIHQPWNVIISKRKAAEAVAKVTASLTNSSVLVDGHWHGALARLLEIHQALPPALQPPQNPQDYLTNAAGFREAYSQHGCNPPRHITLCATSLLENNKCEWLGEAGAVYGVLPPLQCARRPSTAQCMLAVSKGEADAVVADGDWLVTAQRNYFLTPILHEATPIINEMPTIFAYVRKNSGINKVSDLRGKRATFPSFDGVAWHTVLRYLSNNQKESCNDVANKYFSSICAPEIENYNVTDKKKEQYTKTCYKEGDKIVSGEIQALRSVVESRSDVAFISRMTYNLYSTKHIQEPWAKELVDLVPVCPDENPKYCFLSWTNVGHIFASSNITEKKRQEIINVLTSLDQLFGNHAHQLMFSMYGIFNHHFDVLFHNNTKLLATDQMYQIRPYNKMPLNFERILANTSEICKLSDFTTGLGIKTTPVDLLLLSLVLSAIYFTDYLSIL